jgi:hypothetical protein
LFQDNSSTKSYFVFSLGTCYTPNPDGFINTYKSNINQSNVKFTLYPHLSLGLQLIFFPGYRFSIMMDWTNTWFRDAFQGLETVELKEYKRNYIEDIKIQSVPIIIALDLIPYSSQFRSFVSFGAGITLCKIEWDEVVNPEIKNWIRNGGSIYSAVHVCPTIRLAAGVDLRFDRDSQDNFFESLTPELRFTYVHRNIEIFSELAQQIEHPSKSLSESYTIFPYYIGFHIGVSFNVTKILINKKGKNAITA